MERRRLKPVTLFSSDLDGTLAGHPQGTEQFRRRWDELAAGERPILVYNSGRLVDDILSFSDEVGLPAPDYAIGGVGTLLFDPQDPLRMQNFADRFSNGWSLEKIETILRCRGDIERQPEVYQHAFKSSWFLHDAGPELLADLEHALNEAGLSTTMIYSSGRDLDILPSSADKGQALGWLCNELGIELDEVVVAGDTNNDRSMFAAQGTRGIVVGNALPELRDLARDNPLIYTAAQGFALGVVEGLTHWSVFDADPF